ncbi:hypothetical protein AAP_03269 [Ascosphaera apis ARSEF 7405]|uniref:Uncharacterized protein n=1 Tax=Ascosphaera apis ARSEF 7405 TaxID=392613 RepID=A0A162ICP6_9EURO|nr:hypothetical protein AAP_03269 [Ascosphaera apis ARSEF 7405]
MTFIPLSLRSASTARIATASRARFAIPSTRYAIKPLVSSNGFHSSSRRAALKESDRTSDSEASVKADRDYIPGTKEIDDIEETYENKHIVSEQGWKKEEIVEKVPTKEKNPDGGK